MSGINYDEIHYSVMKAESIEALNIKETGIYVDCTTGAGGHSEAIAEHLGRGGRLICIDRDPSALEIAKKRLERFGEIITYVNENFSKIDSILSGLNIDRIDGAVIDLGLSGMQIKNTSRGFSYMSNGALDMRFGPDGSLSAYDVVNTYSVDDLTRIMRDYGEERFARRIAERIVKSRELKPIETTGELSGLIEAVVPKTPKSRGNMSKRVFMSLRIEVNRELEIIPPTINSLIDRLKKDGVLAVISFHSLEDRLVKQTLISRSGRCICPPSFPVCKCGAKAEIRILQDKSPCDDELTKNPPSHSARLRCAVKL